MWVREEITVEKPIIYACSDSLGETAERVARAAASQYDKQEFNIIRVPYIRSEQQIEELVCKAEAHNAMICYTIISPTLRRKLWELTKSANVTVVDIIGPMLAGVGTLTDTEPTLKAGMIHQLDEEYFKRVEAIEFAVKYDDGKNPMGFLKADIVIVGAGPAGIFTAIEMIRRGSKKHITIVEKGQPIEKRRCPKTVTKQCVNCRPYCHITTSRRPKRS